MSAFSGSRSRARVRSAMAPRGRRDRGAAGRGACRPADGRLELDRPIIVEQRRLLLAEPGRRRGAADVGDAQVLDRGAVARHQGQRLTVVGDRAVVVAELAVGDAAIVEGDRQRLRVQIAGEDGPAEGLDRRLVAAVAESRVAGADVAQAVGRATLHRSGPRRGRGRQNAPHARWSPSVGWRCPAGVDAGSALLAPAQPLAQPLRAVRDACSGALARPRTRRPGRRG